MYYAAINKLTCVSVIQKAASQSMSQALQNANYPQIGVTEALRCKNRVAFIRDPLERVNDVFSHVYFISVKYFGRHDIVIPRGIITGDGYHARKGQVLNPHHFTDAKRAECAERIANARGGREISDDALGAELDNQDYRRFIDYVLEGNQEPHWDSQHSQLLHNGELVPNIFVKMESLDSWWLSNADFGEMPRVNFHMNAPHDDYRLDDLRAFYADDLKLREAATSWPPQ